MLVIREIIKVLKIINQVLEKDASGPRESKQNLEISSV